MTNAYEGCIEAGNSYQRAGNFTKALNLYNEASQLSPNRFEAYFYLGVVNGALGNLGTAIKYYEKSKIILLSLAKYCSDDLKVIFNNLAVAYHGVSDCISAERIFLQMLARFPGYSDGHYNFARLLKHIGHAQQAQEHFAIAHKIDPSNPKITALLFDQCSRNCDWSNRVEQIEQLDQHLASAVATQTKPGETPFISIYRTCELAANYQVAKAWSAEFCSQYNTEDHGMSYTHEPNRLHIGYLSADFYEHATMYLMFDMLKSHNQTKFRISVFSYGANDCSNYRDSLSEFVEFHDLQKLNHKDAARYINQQHVDILVDLKGYTQDARLEILAQRPAPIQVGYLGFPGTYGGTLVDYLIVDNIVVPVSDYKHYGEKLIVMPYCYQVNQDISQHVLHKTHREQHNLPDDAVVMCCFNHPFKLTPTIFSIWMDILREQPETVLWLYADNNAVTQKNLYAVAEKNNIDQARIIFAPTVHRDEHLARLALADIAVDTQIYTGHTTTSDALLANVPIITLLGKHFASRVSSSIVHSIDMQELITQNLAEYKQKIISLIKDPKLRMQIRNKIIANKETCSLFKPKLFVQHLESEFEIIWKNNSYIVE